MHARRVLCRQLRLPSPLQTSEDPHTHTHTHTHTPGTWVSQRGHPESCSAKRRRGAPRRGGAVNQDDHDLQPPPQTWKKKRLQRKRKPGKKKRLQWKRKPGRAPATGRTGGRSQRARFRDDEGDPTKPCADRRRPPVPGVPDHPELAHVRLPKCLGKVCPKYFCDGWAMMFPCGGPRDSKCRGTWAMPV